MSDEETYTTPEGVEPRGGREVALGVPEKQPKDLGVHKIVFDNRGQDNPAEVNLKAKESFAQAITIVQEEYCNKEKDAKKKIKDVRNRLISASIICLLFVGLEFAGGYFSNSLIIVADAAQLLTVFSTMMVSLFALRVSGRKPHSSSGFVWYQAEAMMSLASVLVTWMLTSVVMFLAYQRILCFKEDKFKIDVDMMLATSAFGVVANLVCCLVKWDLHQYLLRMGMVLHNNCHVRSCHAVHDLSEAPVANVNVRAAFIHIVCDFLFSLGVFVTALFIDCCPDWHIVDPISSLVFSCFVLFISLAVLKDVLNVLIEDMPKGIYFNDVLKTFLTIDGVQQVQDLRLWAHSLDKIALSAHLTIRPGVDHNEVLKTASRRIHTKYNFYEMTLHVEALQEETPVEPIKEKK